MSGFGATPLDGSSPTPLPMPTAVPDGVTTPTVVEAGPVFTDSNGNKLAPVSMYVKDGNDLTLGSTGDAAYSGSGAGSVIALLKKVEALLAATLTVVGNVTEANSAGIKTDLDSLNTVMGTVADAAWSGSGNGTEIAILKKLEALLAGTLGISGTVGVSSLPAISGSVTANAGTNLNTSALALESGGNLATIVTNTATPNVSDRWARQLGQVDLARVLGAAMAPSNPAIVENNIQNWVRSGNGYSASTGKLASATNGNLTVGGLSIFNPAASGKNILIYRILVHVSVAAYTQANLTTVDPAFSNTVTPQNIKAGGAGSAASVTSSANGVTASVTVSGNIFGEAVVSSSVPTMELLTNGATILLPAGSANGVAIFPTLGTAGTAWAITAQWIEF